MKLADLKILSYQLGGDMAYPVKLDCVSSRNGPERWAVRCGEQCMSINGEWDHEPMPSNRDDRFYATFRFATPEAAIDCWNLHGRKGPFDT